MPLLAHPVDFGAQVWDLPPLILHPFRNQAGLARPRRLEGEEGHGLDDLLCDRLEEMRMLFFLGKDLFRWIEQCVEWVDRTPALAGLGLRPQSFADLAAWHPPDPVQRKLRDWGVVDHGAIFSRACGLHSVFREPPSWPSVSPEFIRHYHRFADHLYACFQGLTAYTEIRCANFRFSLYASGEYSRMLETEWGG